MFAISANPGLRLLVWWCGRRVLRFAGRQTDRQAGIGQEGDRYLSNIGREEVEEGKVVWRGDMGPNPSTGQRGVV